MKIQQHTGLLCGVGYLFSGSINPKMSPSVNTTFSQGNAEWSGSVNTTNHDDTEESGFVLNPVYLT